MNFMRRKPLPPTSPPVADAYRAAAKHIERACVNLSDALRELGEDGYLMERLADAANEVAEIGRRLVSVADSAEGK